MMKRLFAILFSMALMLGAPQVVTAGTSIEIIDNDFQSVAVSVSESVLHITGANGQVLQIYNVAGVRVMSVKIDAQDKRIELNLPKGCYMVKVGKFVRKISII